MRRLKRKEFLVNAKHAVATLARNVSAFVIHAYASFADRSYYELVLVR
ncbi:MAG: hypothetical protein HYY67_02655 [Thaumarchaeota archaeon]|nr:hypothetical protein [Nitrososphaerota archaeon]